MSKEIQERDVGQSFANKPTTFNYSTNWKEDMFAKLYIKHRFNGTRAYMELKPNQSEASARMNASKLMANPAVRAKIISLLPQDDLEELTLIKKAFAAETPDNISYKELHSFVRTSLELKNKLGNRAGNTDIKIGLVINE